MRTDTDESAKGGGGIKRKTYSDVYIDKKYVDIKNVRRTV